MFISITENRRMTAMIHRIADLLLGPIARAAIIVADSDAMLILNPRVI